MFYNFGALLRFHTAWTQGGLYAWELEKEGRELRVWVEGPSVLNTETLILPFALNSFGFGYLFENGVRAHSVYSGGPRQRHA